MNKIFKSFLIITIFSLLSRLIGFIFRVYLSRTIGAEALGLYQVALSVFIVLNTLVCSGIPVIISRTVSGLQDTSRKEEYKLLTVSLVVTVILSLLVIAFVLIFRKLFSIIFTDKICLVVLIILLPTLITNSVYNVYRSYYYGNKKFLYICTIDLIEQISRIIICMLILAFVVSLKWKAIAPAISLSASTVISMIIVLISYFNKKGKLVKINKNDYINLLKESTPITLSRSLTSLIMPIISVITPKLLILAGYSSSEAISLYGIAFAMTLPFLFLPNALISPLSTVMFPEISNNFNQKDFKKLVLNSDKFIFYTIIISTIILPIFLGCGYELANFIYNEPLSGKLLNYSAVLIIPISLCLTTSTILNSTKLEKPAFLSNIVGGILMLFTIIFLTVKIKIYSLILAMFLCFTSTCLINFIILCKHKFISKDMINKIYKISLISIFISILNRLILNILKFKFKALPCTLICFIFSYILLFTILRIFNLFSFDDLKFFKRKFNFKVFIEKFKK